MSSFSSMATFVKGYMMTGDKRSRNPSPIVHKKAVCNDLLSNILRGLVNGSPEDKIIQTIDEHFTPEEVFDARVILFKNFYSLFANDPNDPTEDRHMGAKEKEIKKRWHTEDILEKIHTIGKLEHDVEFCVPWNYRYVIMTEEEKRFRDILDEKNENIDEKFATLEKVIDRQNRATIMAVENSMKESLETVKDVVSEKKLESSRDVFEDAELFKGKEDPIETGNKLLSNMLQDLLKLLESRMGRPLFSTCPDILTCRFSTVSSLFAFSASLLDLHNFSLTSSTSMCKHINFALVC